MQGDGKAAALAPTGAEKVAREVLASGLGAAITDTLFNPLDIIKVPPCAMQASKWGSSCAMQAWERGDPSTRLLWHPDSSRSHRCACSCRRVP